MSCSLFSSIISVGGQIGLEISGPTKGYENDNIVFAITLNGEPTQARVTFEGLTPAKYSNTSTGKVSFTLPSVGYGGRLFTVSASVPGEQNAIHSIRVKNLTKMLTIQISTSPIQEFEAFHVTIQEGGDPVSNAEVWFNSSVYTTNASGDVILTAPDVLVTTNYGIFVNKSGYTANSTMVTIRNADLGQELMELITPYIVEPGEQNIPVKAIDTTGGLIDVLFQIYYEGDLFFENSTDASGVTYIKAPSLQNDTFFSLHAYKEGYITYDYTNEGTIWMLPRNSTFNMTIQPSAWEVSEGEFIIVEVVDDFGYPVPGATIWKGAVELEDKTSSAGRLAFLAPLVFMDREEFLYAIREGYNYAESMITILNIDVLEKELMIDVEPIINETDFFTLHISDDIANPIANATVTFRRMRLLTNDKGSVTLQAPNVISDTFFRINVSKSGYLPTSTSIEIIDLDRVDGIVDRELFISDVSSVSENEPFTLTITTGDNTVVADALVQVFDTYKTTDHEGKVTFFAPAVNRNTEYTITVTKAGYETYTDSILITDTLDVPILYLILAVIIIMSIGVYAYFKNRQNII